MGTKVRTVRFGAFEFDFARQEMLKGQLRIRIAAWQIRLLTLFLEQPGVLISRREIMDRLWTDPQSVDVSKGINTAVNRLRYLLNDDPEQPSYIETLIGVGYRFVAAVEPCAVPFDLGTRRVPDLPADGARPMGPGGWVRGPSPSPGARSRACR